MTLSQNFDVIVIGGGHAGCEAAAASARMGAKTALVTHKFDTIGAMSCNPAIGGLGKGHLVREIDALDGVMGRIIDKSGIQFRMLNASKGPAVQGPRAQADRKLYRLAMQEELSNTPNLTIIPEGAESLMIADNKQVTGVILKNGVHCHSGAVVLTTGTFLRGIIHQGESQTPAGRVGEEPSIGLALSLEKLGLPLGRLKTGTPARLDGRTINWGMLEEQKGDNPPKPFSFLNKEITVPQISCYMTYTSEKTHQIIRDNIKRAPMYSGQITSRGPRYCPSIEDKIMRFADKDRHQIFLEPEGLDDPTVYPNGISTSLPIDVQDALIRSIAGLENVQIFQHGYAIEYDFCDPRDLKVTLESKSAPRLFLAGQINGTTGYEEAAAQGLMAGINAALLSGETGVSRETAQEFNLDRAEAYIGVMIDDLITRGAPEPYRMFTSRAEYRLSLRADNADQRLTDKGLEVGCIGSARKAAWADKKGALVQANQLMNASGKTPNELAKHDIHVNMDGIRRPAFDLINMPNIEWEDLFRVWPELQSIDTLILNQIKIDSTYAGYTDRQDMDIAAFRRDENLILPVNFNYSDVGSLSTEIRQKLNDAKPATLGAASRISGITPTAITALLRYIKKKPNTKKVIKLPKAYSPALSPKLEIYKTQLLKWAKVINLVSPSTLADVNSRHFYDSMQVIDLLPPNTKTLMDIGSGAGFPGMVIAIERPDIEVHLVESDTKKCSFLSTISRETNTPVIIHNARVEAVDKTAGINPDIITARALASLTELLEMTEPWWSKNNGLCLILPKGEKAQEEVVDAHKKFKFHLKISPSQTDEKAQILVLTEVEKL